MKRAIKEGEKRICESIPAFTHCKSPVRHMALVCAQGDFPRSNDDLLGKNPTEPESARTRRGHYVNARGSLTPAKLEGEILDICRCIPSASAADEAAEGKGIRASSSFHPGLLSEREAARGEARSLKIYSHAHADPASESRGRNRGERRRYKSFPEL